MMALVQLGVTSEFMAPIKKNLRLKKTLHRWRMKFSKLDCEDVFIQIKKSKVYHWKLGRYRNT